MNKSLDAIPQFLPKALVTKQLASWPSIFIVLLLIFSVFLSPGFLSIVNFFLLIPIVIKWFWSSKRLNINLARVMAPFGLIAIIGLTSGVGSDLYIYLKDAWYVLNPVLILGVGYALYKKRPDVVRGLRAFIFGGTLIAIFHISSFLIHPELLLKSAVEIREVIGTGHYAPVLALTILVAYFKRWREVLAFPKWLSICCFIFCLLAVVLSFSRTMLIVAVIGVLSSMGYFARHELRRIFVVVGMGFLVFFLLNSNININIGEGQQTFIGKLARSMTELSVEEFTDISKINENWRGYETARALRLYYSGSPVQWVFGRGFGTQVDLGLTINLGGIDPVQFIPIFHNGYVYLLIKGGAVAVVAFFYMLFGLYRVARRSASGGVDRIHSAPARILQAITISSAIMTWIVAGVFNKLDMFPILLAAGYLLGALSLYRLKHS